ncbi:MAG: AI-2E family transporter [Eubacterium sp.]|nr:AI-2E family transporter [Eubacterium sp.]
MNNFFKDEKIRKNIFTGTVLIIVLFLALNIKIVADKIGDVISILSPFILGAAIAFILNVPMTALERVMSRRKLFADGKRKGFKRVLAIIITLFLAILIIAILLNMIIPQLVDTISQLIKQIPKGYRNATKWFDDTFERFPIILDIVDTVAVHWKGILESAASFLKSYINGLLEGGVDAVTGIVSGLLNFVIGFIFSIYILAQKEKLGLQGRKIVYALLKKNKADQVMRLLGITKKTFTNFISGQCVEAIILGSMFLVTMLLLRIPYAPLVSMLIAATSLIPIVGAFIGCGIGALLILIQSPVKALIFLVLFIVLQQIEGNVIYPKVVGSSVGLPGMWVLVSVTVGGSFFGVVGMIVFIPLISVCYALFREYIYKKLDDKGIRKDFIE